MLNCRLRPGPVNAALPARLLWRLCRLPAWEIILLGDACDHFCFDRLDIFMLRFKDRWICQGCEGIHACAHGAPAMSDIPSFCFFPTALLRHDEPRQELAREFLDIGFALSMFGTSDARGPSKGSLKREDRLNASRSLSFVSVF
jgi:hypothetical protein